MNALRLTVHIVVNLMDECINLQIVNICFIEIIFKIINRIKIIKKFAIKHAFKHYVEHLKLNNNNKIFI